MTTGLQAMKKLSLTAMGILMLLIGYGSNVSMSAVAKANMVTDSSDATFKRDVMQASEPVFVDFYTTWCGPCKSMAPVVEELASDYKGRLKVVKVDIDKNPGIAQALGIQSIPTFVMFKKGKPVGVEMGLTPKQVLSSKIDDLIR